MPHPAPMASGKLAAVSCTHCPGHKKFRTLPCRREFREMDLPGTGATFSILHAFPRQGKFNGLRAPKIRGSGGSSPPLPEVSSRARHRHVKTAVPRVLAGASSVAAQGEVGFRGIRGRALRSLARLWCLACHLRVHAYVVERARKDRHGDRARPGTVRVRAGVVVTLGAGDGADDQPDDE